MKRTLLCTALLSLISISHAASWTYRGTLNDGGSPANGVYDLRVSLLNAAKSASVTAPITLYGVQVSNGNFAVDVDFGLDLNNAPAMALKTEVQQGGSGFVSLGEPTFFDAKAALAGVCWDTEGNAGTTPISNFIGTTDNQPFVIRTRNAQSLRIEPSSILLNGLPVTANVIAGSAANSVTAGVRGATIAGGGLPQSFNDPDFDNEAPNRVTDAFGTIGGGYANRAGNDTGLLTDTPYATVSGGVSNIASGFGSTISGGQGHTASGTFATVSGGSSNDATGTNATVSGGSSNTASGSRSSVSGGTQNTSSGSSGTVSGGANNCAGGNFSWAGGFAAEVRPGNENGDGTCAPNSGDTDGDNGTFVWADDQGSNFTSTGARQFLVRAQGGMAINTNAPTPGAALTVSGNMSFGAQPAQMLNLFNADYGIGVQTSRLYFRTNSGFNWFQDGVHNDAADNPGAGGTLRMRLNSVGQLQTTTGTISTLSDARLKDQIQDYTNALDRINALHPVRYHYRDAGKAAFQPEGLHLGFVAQEVQQVFPEWVSKGEDGYLMLSMRGFEAVAVRAMQELSAENAVLKAQVAAQNARLDALEAKLK